MAVRWNLTEPNTYGIPYDQNIQEMQEKCTLPPLGSYSKAKTNQIS